MLRRATLYLQKILSISPAVPRHVDIEISTACNLGCKMCKRQKIDFGDSFMPLATFKKIINSLPEGVETISFGGYGEMLLHPDFNKMVAYARGRGFTTETTSNGLVLDDEAAVKRLVASGLDSLRISIDHIRRPAGGSDVGHTFSKRSLRAVERLSRSAKGTGLRLGINTVVHKENAGEIIDIVRYADDLGLDIVELIRLDTCSNRAERTLPRREEEKIYCAVERMKKGVEVITPANRFAGRRRLYNIKQDFCPFRFQSAHIRIGGAVTPCPFGFAAHDFGSIHKDDLQDIWQGDGFRKIRKDDQNPVCKRCGIFKW